MSNIRCLDGIAAVDPTALLKMAEDWNMTEVVIIGRDATGERMYGASIPEVKDILLHLEWARWKMIRETFE